MGELTLPLSLSEAELTAKCRQLRREIIEVSYRAKTNHIGCNLSIVECMTALLYNYLKMQSPGSTEKVRDYFILSKGHAALVYYLILADKGFFPKEDLCSQWNQNGSHFCEHPQYNVPGVDVSTGALGHGLSIGAGLAFGLKPHGKRVAVLLGDGESGTGQVWEAAAFAAAHRLNNLVAIVDFNNLQGLGRSENITPGTFQEKFAAFGWNAMEVSGNDVVKLAGELSRYEGSKPLAIIAKTRKGNGISFMEDKVEWHYKSLDIKQYELALQECQ